MKVAIIGAGNVATHLVAAFKETNLVVAQIWSQHYENALLLARNNDSVAIHDLSEINQSLDICLISVKDDAIEDVLLKLKGFRGIIAHTSGAIPLDVFEGKFGRYGIFYPLQTFSKSKPVEFNNIPLCLEASDENTFQSLKQLADQISVRVTAVNSDKRKILHLAAVFACNFTNHLYALAEEILAANELPFDIIKPLIIETADKIQYASPIKVQTGPAIRGDEKTIKKHEELLLAHPLWLNIYQTLSESIKKTR